jgi:HAD superfamily hydrolase (TIGR01509 family)
VLCWRPLGGRGAAPDAEGHTDRSDHTIYVGDLATVVPMTAVDAVLFDLDDTLCEHRRSSRELLAVAFERTGVEPFFEVSAYNDRYEDHLEAADGVGEVRERCFEAIAVDRDRDPGLGRALARAYADERDQTDVEPLPGARETVATLGEDHHLGLVTNGPPDVQREKLAAVGLADAFDVEVFAGFGVPAKPDPEPFHRALEPLDAGTDRAVHVGNSLRTDVPGAKRAGLRAAWLREDGADPGDGHRPDYVLDALGDLASPPWA